MQVAQPAFYLNRYLFQDGDACSDQLEDHLEVRKLNPSKQKKDFFYLGLGITQPLFGVVFCLRFQCTPDKPNFVDPSITFVSLSKDLRAYNFGHVSPAKWFNLFNYDSYYVWQRELRAKALIVVSGMTIPSDVNPENQLLSLAQRIRI